MENKDLDEFLDRCVKKSLEHYREGLHDATALATAMECPSLHPDVDPFEMFAFQLMASKYRKEFGITDVD